MKQSGGKDIHAQNKANFLNYTHEASAKTLLPACFVSTRLQESSENYNFSYPET
jgi:hypothetical protein